MTVSQLLFNAALELESKIYPITMFTKIKNNAKGQSYPCGRIEGIWQMNGIGPHVQ
jgi:hypothetical protein